jgi:DNA-binding NtrC family response regulator
MSRKINLLVADRNPHVRTYLHRELTAAGYGVWLVASARDLMTWMHNPIQLDLLILDPELPGLDRDMLHERIQARQPRLKLVLHAIAAENHSQTAIPTADALVEKSGRSLLTLKTIVEELTQLREETIGEN